MRKAIFFVFIIITFNLSAQDTIPVTDYVDYNDQREYTIADIQIKGLKYLQPAVLINLSGLKVGNKVTIPGDDISNAIEKYWQHGLFSDVKIMINRIEEDKVYLDIFLMERPRLSKLNIHGVNKSETSDLKEQIQLKPGSQVTDNVINNTKIVIEKHFVKKGFYNTEVKIVPKDDTAALNKVVLDVYIEKNHKVKIADVVFEGNELILDKRLARVMKKTKKKNLNFFKSSKFIETDFKEDKDKLVAFYNEKGFRDAQILNTELVKVNDKRIALKIELQEGPKYHIRSLRWVGNTKYPTEYLDRILGMKKGDVYDQKLLDERLRIDEDAITSLYMDNGYLFFSVDPIEINVENDSVDLEMRVFEGKQATINQIIIKGNTKTNEHVVRRELYTRPGELFSKSDIIRSVRELATLGHFDPEKISPNPIPNPDNGTVDLEYQLEERANDQLEVSGGWGGFGFVGTIGVKFSNFAAKNMFNPKAWRPVPTGDGQTLSIRAQSNGRYYQGYNLSFVEPWFGGKKPNSFSVSLFHTGMKNYDYYNTSDRDGFFRIYGGSVGLGRRLKWPDDYFTLYNEVGYQQYHLNKWENRGFFLTNGNATTFTFKTSLSRSSQDQMIYPRKGSVFSLTLQVTPPYSLFRKDNFWELSSEEKSGMTEAGIAGEEVKRKFNFIEYHKWSFKSAWYTSLVGNLVLATKAEFGLLGYYNKDIGHAPFEKFAVGGSGMYYSNYYYGNDIVALRGYDEGTLTPKSQIINSSGNYESIDNGNIYTKYTLELRYPFTMSQSATIYGLVFLEGGSAWSNFNEFNPFSIKRSAGVGLRAFLPMFGLLGVDWGYGFDPAWGKTQKHGSQFHFMMGQQF